MTTPTTPTDNGKIVIIVIRKAYLLSLSTWRYNGLWRYYAFITPFYFPLLHLSTSRYNAFLLRVINLFLNALYSLFHILKAYKTPFSIHNIMPFSRYYAF